MSIKNTLFGKFKSLKFNIKKFLGIGWKSKISQKRATFFISINKLIAEGNCLEKGQILYSYLAEDRNNRKIMVTYLDGKKMSKSEVYA